MPKLAEVKKSINFPNGTNGQARFKQQLCGIRTDVALLSHCIGCQAFSHSFIESVKHQHAFETVGCHKAYRSESELLRLHHSLINSRRSMGCLAFTYRFRHRFLLIECRHMRGGQRRCSQMSAYL